GCILLNCSSHGRIEIPIDRTPFENLQSEALVSEIQNQTAEYQKLENLAEKPYFELTLGYLNYLNNSQGRSLKEAENYFTKASTSVGSIGNFSLREYALYYLGQMKLEAGKCKEAGAFHRELLEKYPESVAKNRFEKVWRELCESKKLESPLPPLTREEKLSKRHLNLYERALKNERDKNYPIAIWQFQKFLNSVPASHPEVESALEKLLVIYKRQNDKQKQLRYLTLLSRYQKADPQKFPYSPKWLLELAKFHWNHERPEITQKYIELLIRWPYHRYLSNSYFILSKIAAENKDFQKAKESIDLAATSNIRPQVEEEISYLRGWYAYRAADYKAAIEVFKQFRRDYPESDYFDTATYWLAQTHKKTGDIGEANDHFHELADKNPYSYYGIRSLHHLKKQRKAIQFEKQLIFRYSKRAFGSEHIAPFLKGEKLIHLGFGKDGVDELRSATTLPAFLDTPWLFQYYIATLYHLGKDYISSIVLLSQLQKKYLDDLPDEHLLLLYPKQYWDLVQKYAKKFSLDPFLILSIMRQESAFNPNAVSPADAIGLLQMTPYIGKAMAKRLKRKWRKNDLFDPDKNLLYCAFYLSRLMKKFRGNLTFVLASYNANEENAQKWIKRYWTNNVEEFIEEIPYKETRSYVKLIMRNYTNYLFVHEGVFKPSP
ncbi:MAG: transglycosylase SLT domain-containing protein, partial [Deltaproteobacteria bacterium]